MSHEWPYKKYRCAECGREKDIMVNHDGLPELFDRCTEACMWSSKGELGPVLYSAEGEKTGFHKRKFVRVQENTCNSNTPPTAPHA